MPENTELKISRILLAFDAWGCSPASLQRAISLAEQIKAQIHGVYIEDSDLLQMAELPFTREVSFGTAQPRSLNSTALNRRLRSLANELRLMLEQQAKLAAIYATFSTVRGQRLPIILQESRSANLTILPGSLSWRFQQQQAEHAVIAAIFNHHQPDRNVLDIAMSLAQKEHAQLMLFYNSLEARDSLLALLADTSINYRLQGYRDSQQLLGYLQRLKPRAMVIGSDNALISETRNIQMLSQSFKCDLFISRSEQ